MLALLLTDRVAGVARRARVDRGAAVGRVLGDVWRDVEVAQIVDELVHIINLVGAERASVVAAIDKRQSDFSW